MTTTTIDRETIDGLLVEAKDAQRGQKVVKVFSFKQMGNDYPTNVTWWPPRTGNAHPPALVLGHWYRVTMEKKPTGEAGKFYRDYLEAAECAEPEGAPQQAPAAQTRPAGGGERQEPPVDRTRDSIEKQVALKCATELAVARIGAGEPMNTWHVLRIAETFFGYLQETPERSDLLDNEFLVHPPAAAATPPGAASAPPPTAQAKATPPALQDVTKALEAVSVRMAKQMQRRNQPAAWGHAWVKRQPEAGGKGWPELDLDVRTVLVERLEQQEVAAQELPF